MTDPARTTKLTRQELVRVNDEFKSERDAAKGDAMRAFDERNIALNAADALRAQVAALQAENERLKQDACEWDDEVATLRGQLEYAEHRAVALKKELTDAHGNLALANAMLERTEYQNHKLNDCKAELAAAQAKLAVPAPADVTQITTRLESASALLGDMGYSVAGAHMYQARAIIASLARDNAALRTQAEALERERDDREAMLGDVLEFLDGYVDVVDGDYGQPAPNRAMSLVQQIEQMCPALAEKP